MRSSSAAGTVGLIARMDLSAVTAAPGFAAELRDLARQNRANELVLFAYSEQPEPARSFLTGLVAALPARLVNDAVYVDGSRWWSLTCDQACCPAEGTPYDVAGHRLAAEAVFAGLTTRASREELAATVAGPPPAEVPRLAELASEARPARAGQPTSEDPAVRLVRSVRAGLGRSRGSGRPGLRRARRAGR